MATGATAIYQIPYPLPTDGVDVAGDVQDLATTVDTVFQAKAPLASPAFTGTPTAPTAAADNSSTQVATTAFVIGQAGTATPLINGTAQVGISLKYARQDHAHPVDTSRAPAAGSSSITTVGTITSGAWQSTTAIAAAYGGTGLTSYTTGDILYASGTSALAKLAAGSTGNALLAGTTPSWGKIGLTTHVSGTLPTANGGTGLTGFTSGGAVYASSTSALTTGTLPTGSGGTGLTTFTSGGAVYATSTSALTTGTLPVASGGTGSTTAQGTGSVVLATSPTITTPTISTPTITGGTISNATSITLTGAQTLAAWRVRNMYVSTTDPGSGNDGDIWLKY